MPRQRSPSWTTRASAKTLLILCVQPLKSLHPIYEVRDNCTNLTSLWHLTNCLLARCTQNLIVRHVRRYQ